MKYSHLNKIVQETGLSPEQLADAFGVSNMTLRRWSKEPGGKELSVASARTIIEGIYRLISEGVIDPKSAVVQQVLESSPSGSFEAVLKSMGVSPQTEESQRSYKDRMTMALFQIGSSKKHQEEVEKSSAKLRWFQKMGDDWKAHISGLIKVIKFKEISVMDKMIAYGALFYLISPTDLIPDALPFVGIVDDYSFLVLATVYYASKFPKIVSEVTDSRTAIPT